MPRIAEETKLEREDRVISALRRHPNGISEDELSDLLSIERRTLNNYLRGLERKGRAYKEDTLWFIEPEYEASLIRHLEVSPEQAVTLYLATRLLVKQNDKRNEAAETALYKLADMLTGDLNVGEEIRQAARELAERPGDQEYSNVFRTVVQGYLYRHAVRVTYAPRGIRPFQATIYPYLLEPSPIGFTTYIIGLCNPPNALRTYKLERIIEAELTDEPYDIPPDFPGLDTLRNAWSIIHGDELVKVVLRFHPRVADRVLETRWHLSQQTYPDPDNPSFLMWSAEIADLTDFIPWVRSWGADVEALAPQDLRDELQGEAYRLAGIYGQTPSSSKGGETQRDEAFEDFFGD
ncbi:MAG: WYL domain-containing protein [Anaerolineae bacterium]|nr:WYL domain-containing protein [Anaerolineae bacterium]